MRSPAALVAAPLAALLLCALAPATAAPAQSPAPTLQLTATSVRQIGADLQFELRLDRALPVDRLPGAGSCASC